MFVAERPRDVRAETGAGAARHGLDEEETAGVVAGFRLATDEVEHDVAHLRAVGVVPARPVVSGTGLEREGALGVVLPSARLLRATDCALDNLGLHVDEHRARGRNGAGAVGGIGGGAAGGLAEERVVDLGARRGGAASASFASVSKNSAPT